MNVIGTMVSKPRELNQGGTGTSALVFSVDGTTPVYLRFPTSEQLGSATTGPSSSMIRVTAWGRAASGTTTNYTATLQFGTSVTAASNTTIEASTARALASGNHNWCIQVDLVNDVTSSKLQGRGWSQVASIVDAVAAVDNIVSTADPDANGTLCFVVAGTFSSGSATNTAYLDGFTLERLGG